MAQNGQAQRPAQTSAQKTARISTRRLRVTRDGVLFFVGLCGIVYETVVGGAERPTLLLLFAAMVGLPAFLNKDEREQAARQQSAQPEPEPAPPPQQSPQQGGEQRE